MSGKPITTLAEAMRGLPGVEPQPMTCIMSWDLYAFTMWRAKGNKGKPPKAWVRAFIDASKKAMEAAKDGDDEEEQADPPTH